MKLAKYIGCIFVLSVVFSSCIEDDELNPCFEPHFTIEQTDSPNNYVAVADFDGIDEVSYSWFVNDNIVETVDANSDLDNRISLSFPGPGTYKICLVISSEECDRRLEFCIEITIEEEEEEERCYEPAFRIHETDRPDLYKFSADFKGIDSVVYAWYVDGELVEVEELNDERDNMLLWEFDPGTHHVCIVVRTDKCDEQPEYCKRFVVDIPCPELSFEGVENPNNVYTFEAKFRGREHVQYSWYINGELVDKENFDGVETDHKLFWQFEPGEYRVCILVDTDRCEQVEFCKTIVAEEPARCPDMFFEIEEVSSRNYQFFADFEGINDLEWYGWFINGELVENEGQIYEGDNFLDFVFEQEGTYDICIMTETPGCPLGTRFCKTIDVVFDQACKDISFTAVKEPNAPAYTFTADFDGRNEVTYIWSVFVNGDLQGSEVREAGSDDDHEFYWQFQPGQEYVVCLRQDGNACANFQACKEILIN